MFCDRTHSSICQTSIDSNLGVLLRAGTDEKVPDKLVNTIRARKVPNNVTDVSFSNIEVNPRGFRILTRRISTSDIHGWHGYRAWTSLGRCAAYLQPQQGPWRSPKSWVSRSPPSVEAPAALVRKRAMIQIGAAVIRRARARYNYVHEYLHINLKFCWVHVI